MTGRHTPGPWNFDAETGEVYHDDGDVRPLVLTVNMDGCDPAQVLADMRLASAGPDLLAAATSFIAALEGADVDYDELAASTRAAIARATGEAA